MQWAVFGVAIVGVVAALIYFGGDWGGQPAHGGGGGTGAPAVVTETSRTDHSNPAG